MFIIFKSDSCFNTLQSILSPVDNMFNGISIISWKMQYAFVWVGAVRNGVVQRSCPSKTTSSHQLPQVSIHAAPDKWSQTHYALEASLKLLDFYENYFDIHYPLAKLGRFKFHIIIFIFRTYFDFVPLSMWFQWALKMFS